MDFKGLTKREIATRIDRLNYLLNGYSSHFTVYCQYYTKSELINYYNIHFN